MTISNYPNGFLNGVTIRDVPLQQSQPGQVFWVNSSTVLAKGGIGGSNGNPGTYTKPFSTLDYAVGRCTASRGDIIMLMPGFTETVSTATALALDVAGVAIVGLGSGTLRPNITLDTVTTATIAVSAANISIKNVIFTASFADIAELFTPTAVDFHCEDCKFTASAADLNFIEIADTSTVDNEVDGLSFLRCEWIEPDLSTTSLVNVDADIDRLSVVDCVVNLGINGVISCLAEVAAGKDLTNVNIAGNKCTRLVVASAVGLITFADTTTTNTGNISGNFWTHRDIAGELLLTAGTLISTNQNFASGVINTSGYLLPVADS
tara:strand:- start:74 stop:1036 length:963 start_codon:yes stop_codon:yes gene_type:complete